jgi:hypothetical protein
MVQPDAGIPHWLGIEMLCDAGYLRKLALLWKQNQIRDEYNDHRKLGFDAEVDTDDMQYTVSSLSSGGVM